jgi:hypothetical protein
VLLATVLLFLPAPTHGVSASRGSEPAARSRGNFVRGSHPHLVLGTAFLLRLALMRVVHGARAKAGSVKGGENMEKMMFPVTPTVDGSRYGTRRVPFAACSRVSSAVQRALQHAGTCVLVSVAIAACPRPCVPVCSHVTICFRCCCANASVGLGPYHPCRRPGPTTADGSPSR